jgi:hypothetical protein
VATSPQFVAAPKMFAVTAASCEWMNELLLLLSSLMRQSVSNLEYACQTQLCPRPQGWWWVSGRAPVWDFRGPQNRCLGCWCAGWKPCQSLLPLSLTCGCRRLVGWVCCLCFQKKIQKTKNTQLCVCVCGFWVHSQVELLIIGAFNDTVHSMDGALVALHSLWPAFS